MRKLLRIVPKIAPKGATPPSMDFATVKLKVILNSSLN